MKSTLMETDIQRIQGTAMNRIIEEFRRDDERVLDRLADGELPEEDRRALLGALDDEPGAWRRCALAFLESQFWCGDFRAIRNEPVAASEPVKSTPTNVDLRPAPAPARSWRIFDYALAIAASLFVAFGAGLWTRGVWNPLGAMSAGMQVAGQGSSGPGVPTTTVAARGTAHVRIDDPITHESSDVHVPVVEAKDMDPSWLRQPRSTMPDDIRRSLESSGNRVIHQQVPMTIELNDGRRLVVPVEQLDVQPDRPKY